MAQINLYYRTQLEEDVTLLPKQTDANIDKHLLDNLKTKILKKANDTGIVLRVNRLIGYNRGMIGENNFMASTVFKVKYECLLCSPSKGLEIVFVVDNLVSGYIVGKNGPVVVAVYNHGIDTKKFSRIDNNIVYNKTKEPIAKGDYLKVLILKTSIHRDATSIYAICKILDYASKAEIKIFEEDQAIVTNAEPDDSIEFI